MTEFLAVERKARGFPKATITTYINLDAILYVEASSVKGEPTTVFCGRDRVYYLVDKEAEELVARLEKHT